MHDRKAVRTLIRSIYKPFAVDHSFTFLKQTLLTRVRNDFLHIINFDVTGSGFDCHYAVQPLYIPLEFVSLSCGVRLKGAYGMGDMGKTEQELHDLMHILESTGLPWIDNTGCAEGLIKFLSEKARQELFRVWLPPADTMLMGFSHIYLGNISSGVSELRSALSVSKDDNRDWVVKENAMIEEIISIAKTNPEMLKAKLAEYIEFTKAKIGV